MGKMPGTFLQATVRYATEAVASSGMGGARFPGGGILPSGVRPAGGSRDTVEVLRHNVSMPSTPIGAVFYNASMVPGLAAPGAGIDEGSADGTEDSDGLPLVRLPMLMIVLLSIAYSLVFLLAIVNNGLVVMVIYRTPQMRNTTNYFLANLAVADITVSFIVLPITLLSNIFTEWMFGAFLCKATPYLQAVVVSASVNTLAAVAVERYFAIFYPQKQIIRPEIAAVIVAVIWLIPMCIHVPWAIYYQQIEWRPRPSAPFIYLCTERFSSPSVGRGFFLGVVFLTCYLVPLAFISICYSFIGIKVWKRNVAGIRGTKTERNIHRSKIRIVRMLITVAAVFAFSWLPLYSLRMRRLFGPPMDESEGKLMRIIVPLAQWLGSFNSCVNPLIYCYFSEQFRKGILAVLKSRSCCSKVNI